MPLDADNARRLLLGLSKICLLLASISTNAQSSDYFRAEIASSEEVKSQPLAMSILSKVGNIGSNSANSSLSDSIRQFVNSSTFFRRNKKFGLSFWSPRYLFGQNIERWFWSVGGLIFILGAFSVGLFFDRNSSRA